MDWLHQAQTARQNHARRSQMKKLPVLSSFLDQKFAGNLKEVAQIVPGNTKTSLCLQKRQNLVLSGTIWPTSLQTSGAGSQIEPAIFFVWLRLASSGMVLSGTSGLGVTTP